MSFDLSRHSGHELTQHNMSKNVYFICREKNRYQWKSVFCSSPNSDNTLGGPTDTGVSANYFSLFVLLLNTVIHFVLSMRLLNLVLSNVTAYISQTLQCTKLGNLSLCLNLKINTPEHVSFPPLCKSEEKMSQKVLSKRFLNSCSAIRVTISSLFSRFWHFWPFLMRLLPVLQTATGWR